VINDPLYAGSARGSGLPPGGRSPAAMMKGTFF